MQVKEPGDHGNRVRIWNSFETRLNRMSCSHGRWSAPAQAHIRGRTAWLLLAWCVTWVAFALTPTLAVHAQGASGTPTAATAVALAHYSTDTPDEQCVDGTVFDGLADPFKKTGSPVPVRQSHRNVNPFALVDASALESAGGVCPTSPAARALALPLQGHMTRLRI